MFVADGAGSASHGGEGADTAVQAAAEFIAAKLENPHFSVDEELACECVAFVRQRLLSRAAAEGLSPRDVACTFLGVVSSVHAAVVTQVGDGGIVIDLGLGLEVPVVPMSGEYANMTHFITDEDAEEIMVTRSFATGASKVAVFSDGLQRLALNMTTNQAHEPFFEPLFRVLATATEDQCEQLEMALVRFLSSQPVNDRTDDDKTLALAVRIE